MAAISPICWRDGVLELLDQRCLPGEEAWLRCSATCQVADAIRSLAVRGAPAIGIAAAYGLALAAARGEDLAEAARMLGDTRPTAVNLRWALNRTLAAGREGALAEAHRIFAEQVEADRRMGELGAELLAAGDRVLTHCNAGALATGGRGTAVGVLRSAWETGRLAHVWVGETRPLLQGARLTAWELEREGIPYRVVADSGAGSLMARGLVSRVIVGADRIARNGDVANKVGTYPLAVLADRHLIPFYVAAPVSTIDHATPSGDAIEIEEREPAEVVELGGRRIAPPGAEAANPAFDVTPAELVTAIVTEAGVLEPPYEEAIAGVLG
ncbi:MAG TPA: S-methyl-5-thioribose-1-phosphate isomerase [Thermoleophilaceae bacterium]|jgi:methylthioribose-1-phosphate isomerase